MGLDDWLVGNARVASRPHRRVRLHDLLTYFQQLSTLTCSGTPLLQAIRICAEESPSLGLRRTLKDIAGRVAAGTPLHVATAAHPGVFEPHWVEVVRTGEITGHMGPVLLELARQVRETRETRRKVLAALVYPVVLIVVATAAMAVMLGFVVPTFAAMFRDMGSSLPAVTQLVVDVSGFVVKDGWMVLALVAGAAVLVRRYARTEAGRKRLASLGLATPLLGEFIVQAAMYRFTSNLALLLKSGTPMLETLGALGGVFHGNPVYREALARVQAAVAGGRALAVALEETCLFTSMVTNMARVGEESGQLADVMAQLAPYYKEKMEGLIARLTKLVEPAIIIGMGGAVAGLLLAIYLPMFEMAGKIH